MFEDLKVGDMVTDILAGHASRIRVTERGRASDHLRGLEVRRVHRQAARPDVATGCQRLERTAAASARPAHAGVGDSPPVSFSSFSARQRHRTHTTDWFSGSLAPMSEAPAEQHRPQSQYRNGRRLRNERERSFEDFEAADVSRPVQIDHDLGPERRIIYDCTQQRGLTDGRGRVGSLDVGVEVGTAVGGSECFSFRAGRLSVLEQISKTVAAYLYGEPVDRVSERCSAISIVYLSLTEVTRSGDRQSCSSFWCICDGCLFRSGDLEFQRYRIRYEATKASYHPLKCRPRDLQVLLIETALATQAILQLVVGTGVCFRAGSDGFGVDDSRGRRTHPHDARERGRYESNNPVSRLQFHEASDYRYRTRGY